MNILKKLKNIQLLIGAVILSIVFTGCGLSTNNQDKTSTESASTDTESITETSADNLINIEPTTETIDNSDSSNNDEFVSSNDEMPDRVIYEEGFYYESLSQRLKDKITGISYDTTGVVTYDILSYVCVKYVDFNQETQYGELIVNKAIAPEITEIFYKLYEASYEIESIKLIDEYNGDDNLSMSENNTSSFNYRIVTGTTNLSKHSYGLAIDINPRYNPYVVDGNIRPENATDYADRTLDFEHKIDEQDLCYQLFKEKGYTWGGNWINTKDYQHFQKEIN